MKQQTSQHEISVTLVDHVQLDLRELKFLRLMAQHCVSTSMRGYAACEALDALLDGMGVPAYVDADGPTYALFESDS